MNGGISKICYFDLFWCRLEMRYFDNVGLCDSSLRNHMDGKIPSGNTNAMESYPFTISEFTPDYVAIFLVNE